MFAITCFPLTQIFEREVKREKILEGRRRELKLKLKQQGAAAASGGGGLVVYSLTIVIQLTYIII